MSELAPRFGVQLTKAQLEAVDALVAERNEGKEPHYSRWSRQRVLREAVDQWLYWQQLPLAPEPRLDDPSPVEQPELDVEEAVEEAVEEGELRKRRAALYHVYSRALEDGCARRLTEPPVQPAWLAARISEGLLGDSEDLVLRLLAQDPMNKDAVFDLYRHGPKGVEFMRHAVRTHYGLPKLDLHCEEVERWLKGDQDESR